MCAHRITCPRSTCCALPQGDAYPNAGNYSLPREALVAQHAERFVGVHRKWAEKMFQPKPNDMLWMSAAAKNSGAFSLHYGAFVPTLMAQCSQEQQMRWLLPAVQVQPHASALNTPLLTHLCMVVVAQLKIIGCLAQTELGHGSNVRALQTTATYDRAAREWELNTPSLCATKFWPGGLGKTATHCCLYAQVIIDGKEHGLHTFILQVCKREPALATVSLPNPTQP